MKIRRSFTSFVSGALSPIHSEIINAKTRTELHSVLGRLLTLKFEEPVDLHQWITVLNVLDAALEEVLLKYASYFQFSDKNGSNNVEDKYDDDFIQNIEHVYRVLEFTSVLLKNSYNKDIYSSAEHLQVLLKASDDQIAKAALKVLVRLSEPPLNHRCLHFNKHTTSIHKNTALCSPMFQIVDAANWPTIPSAKELVRIDFPIDKPEYAYLEYDFTHKSRPDGITTSSMMITHENETDMEQNSNSSAIPGSVTPSNTFVIQNIFLESKSSLELVRNLKTTPSHKFTLLWRIRLHRMLREHTGRIELLRIQYQAILVLINCHPNSSVLAHFFHDKTDLLRDFVFMLRTGPGSADFDPYVPLELRELACQCLVAIVGSRDSSTISVLGRFSWLQYDLGVNRGQYMGLLPCMLRSAVSFILSLSSKREKMMTKTSKRHSSRSPRATSNTTSSSCSSSGDAIILSAVECEERLVWTEHIFVLTTALINVSSALPALTDNGFISLLISVLQQTPSSSSTDLQTYVEGLIFQVLEVAISNHTVALNIFKDMDGMELVFTRLVAELDELQMTNTKNIGGNIGNKSDSSRGKSLRQNDKKTTTPRSSSSRSTLSTAKVANIESPQRVLRSRKKTQQNEAADTPLTSNKSEIVEDDPDKMDVSNEDDVSYEGMITSVSASKKVIVVSLLNLCSLYFHEALDSGQGQIVRGPFFSKFLKIVFQNANAFGPYALSPAYSMLTDVINNDPSVLSFFIGNKLVQSAIVAMLDKELEHHSDSMLSIGNAISAFALTSGGLDLVKTYNPFPPLFSVFHTKSRLNSGNLTVSSDVPVQLGSNLEELVRHHPSLLPLCMKALTDEMGLIIGIAEFSRSSTVSPETQSGSTPSTPAVSSSSTATAATAAAAVGPSVGSSVGKRVSWNEIGNIVGSDTNFLDSFHFTTAVLACLEPLLVRKQNVVEFVHRKGCKLLLNLLRVALTPTRYLISILSCATDPTTHSLGHYPIVKAVSRCLGQMAEFESKEIMSTLLDMLDAVMDELESDLVTYWAYTSPAGNSASATPSSEETATGVVETVIGSSSVTSKSSSGAGTSKLSSRKRSKPEKKVPLDSLPQMQTEQSQSRVSQFNLSMFLDSVPRKPLQDCWGEDTPEKHMTTYVNVLRSFVVLDYVVEAFASALQLVLGRPSLKSTLEVLNTPKAFAVLRRLTLDVYVNSQTELCRARGCLTDVNKTDRVKAHPIYRLLVVGGDGIVVKDNVEEIGKKLYKLEKGAIVDAQERITNSANHLRYRIDDGWVSYFRTGSSPEPQIEVIDVLPKPSHILTSEKINHDKKMDTAQKKFDFEKFANVSPRRGGFMTLFHFHSCMRHLLSSLSWSFAHVDHSVFSVFSTREPRAVTSDHTLKLLPLVCRCLKLLLPDDISNLMPPPLTSATELALETGTGDSSNFFMKMSVPTTDQFDIAHTFHTVHVVELVHYILFDERPGHRGEPNTLVLVHMFYEGLLERLVHATTLVFLSCLHPPAGEGDTSSCPSSSSSSGGTSSASFGVEETKDSFPRDGSIRKMDLFDVVDDDNDNDDDDDDNDDSPTPGADGVATSAGRMKRQLKDRAMLAVSNIDIVIDLWKQLFHSFSSTSRSTLTLQDAADDNHDFDILVFQKRVFIMLVRYLSQTWSHSLLHTLLPTTVRNVLELVQTVIKALLQAKNENLRRSTPVVRARDFPRHLPSQSITRSSVNPRYSGRLLDAFGPSSESSAAPSPFVFDEETVQTLVTMRFERDEVISAMRALRTNDINRIMGHFLRRSGGSSSSGSDLLAERTNATTASNPLPSSSSATESSVARMTSGESSSTPSELSRQISAVLSSSSHAPSGADSVQSFFEELVQVAAGMAVEEGKSTDEIAREDIAAIVDAATTSSSTVRASTSSAAVSYESLRQVEPLDHLLPLIPRRSTEELKLDKRLMGNLYKKVYTAVPPACLRLIERGIRNSGVQWRTESAATNQSITREVSTVMVLNNMLKCLDRPNWSDGTLQIIQLTSLFPRAITVLKESISSQTASCLYGLLHAILLLLSGKVPNLRNTNHSNEMMFLVCARDSRFNKLYGLLVDALEAQIDSDISNLFTTDSPDTDWIAPALLILDVMTQPLLVDRKALREALKELEKINQIKQSFLEEPSRPHNQEPIITPELNAALRSEFLEEEVTLEDFFECSKSAEVSSATATSGTQTDSLGDGVEQTNVTADIPSTSADSVVSSTATEATLGEPTAAAASSGTGDEVTSNATKAPTKSRVHFRKRKADSEEISGSAAGVSSNTTSSTPAPKKRLPLVDTGLPEELRVRCVSVCLRLLGSASTEGKRVSSMAHAAMQLLVHLTRDSSIRSAFQEQRGVQQLLQTTVRFDGVASVMFTLIQQVLEDPKYLCFAMESAMRTCIHRLLRTKRPSAASSSRSAATSKSDGQRVLFRQFVELLAPIIFRDQALFMSALSSVVTVERVGDNLYVKLKASDTISSESSSGRQNRLTASIETPSESVVRVTADSATADVSREDVGPPAQKRARDEIRSGADNGASVASSTGGDVSRTPQVQAQAVSHSLITQIVSASASSMQNVVDQLLLQILAQWDTIRLIKEGNSSATSSTVRAQTLTISDTLVILADLVSSVPGLATCIHRFNLSKACERVDSVHHKLLTSCLLGITHSITGEPLVSTYFLTFLINRLIAPDVVSSPDQTPTSTSSGTTAGGSDTSTSADVDTRVMRIAGAHIRDSASYLLAALASRPGDGRRRTLRELLNVLRMGSSHRLDTSPRLRAAQAIAETLHWLLNPRPTWKNRETLAVPTRDILTMLASLKAYAVLNDALCAIAMEHPLAVFVSVAISVPLEQIVRKGLPLVAEVASGASSQSVIPVSSSTLKRRSRSRSSSNNIVTDNTQREPTSTSSNDQMQSVTTDSIPPPSQNVTLTPGSPPGVVGGDDSNRLTRTGSVTDDDRDIDRTVDMETSLTLEVDQSFEATGRNHTGHDEGELDGTGGGNQNSSDEEDEEDDDDEDDGEEIPVDDEDDDDDDEDEEEEEEEEEEEDGDDDDDDGDGDDDDDEGRGNEDLGMASAEGLGEEGEGVDYVEEADEDEGEDGDAQDDDTIDHVDNGDDDLASHHIRVDINIDEDDEEVEVEDLDMEDEEDDDDDNVETAGYSAANERAASNDQMASMEGDGVAEDVDEELGTVTSPAYHAISPPMEMEVEDDEPDEQDEDGMEEGGVMGMFNDMTDDGAAEDWMAFPTDGAMISMRARGRGRSHVLPHPSHASLIHTSIRGVPNAMVEAELSRIRSSGGAVRVRISERDMLDSHMMEIMDHLPSAGRRHGGSNIGRALHTSSVVDFRNFVSQVLPSSSYPRSTRDTTNPTGAGAHPVLHPLLAVTDPRPSTRQYSSSSTLGASRGQNMMDAIISAVAAQGGAMMIDGGRAERSRLSLSRRRGVVPNQIVSDRRWGTDVGDLDTVGARLPSFASAVENCLGDFVDIVEDPARPATSSSSALPSSSSLPSTRDRSTLQGRESRRTGIRDPIRATIARSEDEDSIPDMSSETNSGDGPPFGIIRRYTMRGSAGGGSGANAPTSSTEALMRNILGHSSRAASEMRYEIDRISAVEDSIHAMESTIAAMENSFSAATSASSSRSVGATSSLGSNSSAAAAVANMTIPNDFDFSSIAELEAGHVPRTRRHVRSSRQSSAPRTLDSAVASSSSSVTAAANAPGSSSLATLLTNLMNSSSISRSNTASTGSSGSVENTASVTSGRPVETDATAADVPVEPPPPVATPASSAGDQPREVAAAAVPSAAAPSAAVAATTASTSATSQSATASRVLVCPAGVDPEIWQELPEELQLELIAQEGGASEEFDPMLLATTQLDREALAALPPEMRNEVLREEATERIRRQSFDLAENQSATAATTTAAAATAASASDPSRPNDNTLFLASLTPDLRRDVLLSASEEFLASLPASAQTEARTIRQHQLQADHYTNSIFNMDGHSWDDHRSMVIERVMQEALGGRSHSHGGTGPSSAAVAVTGARLEDGNTPGSAASTTVAASTISLAEDRLSVRPPFGRRLITRLFHHLILSRKGKCPRPLLRLLAVACRYRIGRIWILQAFLALMTCDTVRLSAVLENIPPDRRLMSVRHSDGRSDSFGHDFPSSYGEMTEDAMDVQSPTSSRDWLAPSLTTTAAAAAATSSATTYGAIEVSATATSTTTSLMILNRVPSPSSWREFKDSYNEEIAALLSRVQRQGQSHVILRRLLSAVNYVTRKTDKLAWYDIMRHLPIQLGGWIFNQLIMLLEREDVVSSANLDVLLHIVEDLCEPLAQLSIEQANRLAVYVPVAAIDSQRSDVAVQTVDNTRGAKRRKVMTASGGAGGGGDDDDDDDDEDEDDNTPPENPEPSNNNDGDGDGDGMDIAQPAGDLTSSGRSGEALTPSEVAQPSTAADSTSVPVTHTDTQSTAASAGEAQSSSSAVEAETATQTESNTNDSTVNIPFPVLGYTAVSVLASVAGLEGCGGALRNRMLRILRTLSLCDKNWLTLLDRLSAEAGRLALVALEEIHVVHEMLHTVLLNQGDASSAMSLPQLSTPSSVTELRLLRVLRLMTGLRASQQNVPQSSKLNIENTNMVSSYIQKVLFGNLWMYLCECLDAVRQLEGIKESEPLNADVDDDMDMDDTFNAETTATSRPQPTRKSEDALQPAMSSLTMRFMPLIECFLTVCGSTVLKSAVSESTIETVVGTSGDTKASTGSKRRKRKGSEITPSTTQEQVSSETGSTQGPSTDNVTAVSAPAIVEPIQRYLEVPGERFRKHDEYQQMQMGLVEGEAAQRLIVFVDRNRVLLNMVLRQNVYLLESSFHPLAVVPRLRRQLHFDIKRAFFKMKLKRMKHLTGRQFGSLRLSVHRQNVFEESFQKLRYCTADEMRRRLSVSFHGEEGVDAGGLTREWYSVLAKEIFNANYCLFIATIDNVTFQPYAHSHINSHHLDYFKFVGRIIGKAICDGHLLDAHFARSFYKHILGLPVNYHDMEAIEPDYYKNLQGLLQHPLEELGLELTFSAELNEFGRVEIVDLVENGRNILVTDGNKLDYVRLITHHRMTTSIRKQTDAFLEGFHELVPPELISIFDAHELELLISGLPDIDLDDLRANTEYHSYKSTDPQINYLWSVLRSFSKEEKALFLQFVTGTSKVPLDGFQALQGARGVQRFNVHKAYGSHLLPSAHTCFNQLDLPEYSSEAETREKLLIAIKEGSEGFGFA